MYHLNDPWSWICENTLPLKLGSRATSKTKSSTGCVGVLEADQSLKPLGDKPFSFPSLSSFLSLSLEPTPVVWLFLRLWANKNLAGAFVFFLLSFPFFFFFEFFSLCVPMSLVHAVGWKMLSALVVFSEKSVRMGYGGLLLCFFNNSFNINSLIASFISFIVADHRLVFSFFFRLLDLFIFQVHQMWKLCSGRLM